MVDRGGFSPLAVLIVGFSEIPISAQYLTMLYYMGRGKTIKGSIVPLIEFSHDRIC